MIGSSSRCLIQVMKSLRFWAVELAATDPLATLLLGLLLRSIGGCGLLINGVMLGSCGASMRLPASDLPDSLTLISSLR